MSKHKISKNKAAIEALQALESKANQQWLAYEKAWLGL
jgi:hypothetical protein